MNGIVEDVFDLNGVFPYHNVCVAFKWNMAACSFHFCVKLLIFRQIHSEISLYKKI